MQELGAVEVRCAVLLDSLEGGFAVMSSVDNLKSFFDPEDFGPNGLFANMITGVVGLPGVFLSDMPWIPADVESQTCMSKLYLKRKASRTLCGFI